MIKVNELGGQREHIVKCQVNNVDGFPFDEFFKINIQKFSDGRFAVMKSLHHSRDPERGYKVYDSIESIANDFKEYVYDTLLIERTA